MAGDQAKRSSAFSGPGRIDVHHHCFPATVPELAPEFATGGATLFGVGFTGKFPEEADAHLKYMDEVGIQTAVVAPSIKNEWHQDWSKEKWVDLCERSLKTQLEYVASNPLRFGCFALLPLPHIPETLEFIRKASQQSSQPDGWGITSQIGHNYLGNPEFDPIWEELNKTGAVLFVHPADSHRPPTLSYGPFVQEFAFDTCRAITDVIHAGIFVRYPQLKFIFSHNGGAFPFLADRIGAQHIDEMIAKNNKGLRLRDVLSQSNLYLDSAITSAMQYPVLKELGIPTEHLLYATDFPYTVRSDSTSSYKAGYDSPKNSGLFDEQAMEDIVRNNSLKLFPRLAGEFKKLTS